MQRPCGETGSCGAAIWNIDRIDFWEGVKVVVNVLSNEPFGNRVVRERHFCWHSRGQHRRLGLGVNGRLGDGAEDDIRMRARYIGGRNQDPRLVIVATEALEVMSYDHIGNDAVNFIVDLEGKFWEPNNVLLIVGYVATIRKVAVLV